MQEYKLISKKGEGTFSEVLKAQSMKTGHYVAIKCMKTHFTSQDQVNQLREIQALRKLSPHPNIIKLLESKNWGISDEPTGRLALVFELMELNMYELIKDRKSPLPQAKVRHYIFQLLKAIDHMHRKGIFHRDIKPENVLLLGDTVKLADFGSCRGTYSAHPYTEYISTRWYRPPECLMTDGYYDQKMDIWGVGCVMYEISTLVPLFPGNNELDMVHRIHNVLGTPSHKLIERFKRHASHMDFNFPERHGTGLDKLLPHATREYLDLLKSLLVYDPEERITAEQALKHEYFKDLWEADRQKEFQNTLFSIRLSPRVKHFNQTQTVVNDKSTPHLFNENERLNQNGQTLKKISFNKPKNVSVQPQSKLPFLDLSLKVEGIFKSSYNMHDSSVEDDYKKGSTLPPLKIQPTSLLNSSQIHITGQSSMNSTHLRKKDDTKKFTSTILKPTLSKNSLFSKKQKIEKRKYDL